MLQVRAEVNTSQTEVIFYDSNNGSCMRRITGTIFCLFTATGVTRSMAYDTMLAVVIVC